MTIATNLKLTELLYNIFHIKFAGISFVIVIMFVHTQVQ